MNLVNKDGCLLLHYAAASLEVAKIVNNECMIVHTMNNSGMTPLHIAYKEMQLDVAKFLVFERKCLLNLGDESLIDINSNLYIHLACQNEGDINLILKVLANKGNINIFYDIFFSL